MSGATVVIMPAAAARPYFRFVDGFGLGADNELPAGDTGLYLCRLPTRVGWPGDGFCLGFPMEAVRAAAVEVWPPARAGLVGVIFTCRPGSDVRDLVAGREADLDEEPAALSGVDVEPRLVGFGDRLDDG
jgi:hypothetical protein